MLLTLIDLTGSLGWLAISAPFAVLALVLIWALVDVRRAPRKRQDGSTGAATVPGGPVGGARSLPPLAAPVEPPPPPAPRQDLQPGPPAGGAPSRSSPPPPPVTAPALKTAAPQSQVQPPRIEPPAPIAPASAPTPRSERPVPPPTPVTAEPAPTPPSPARPVVDAALVTSLERSIRAAVGSGDEASVARLSLQLARALPAGQEHGHDVESYLRRAITVAMRLGDTATHAAARLELGDRVGGRGDMITACEHWQIARQIFWDENRRDGIAEADQRMIANGCPTDWVLNDF